MPLMREEFERITGVLCPLLASGDRVAMARLLHEWKAFTVDKLKLSDIWEPTPFPLETRDRTRPYLSRPSTAPSVLRM